MKGSIFVETVGGIAFACGLIGTVAFFMNPQMFWWGPVALIVGAGMIIESGGSLF